MKKFFTLIATAFVAMAVNAQTWNFSEWEVGTYEDTTKDGLTLNGKWTVDGNNKTVDDIAYTQRIKSGGTRTASFEVKGACTLEFVCCSSSGSEARSFTVSAGEAALKTCDAVAGAPVAQKVDYTGGAATITIETAGGVNFYAIYVKEGGSEPTPDPTPGEPTGAKESFVAVSNVDGAWVAADVFANAVIANGESIVKFGTDNMDVVAVSGTTAKDVHQEAGTDFAGWTEWNDVKWDVKNQGDISFGYILGTGNPAVSFTAEEVLDEGSRTGHYRPAYEFYEADGSKGMPVMGLYYKFSPKANGKLSVSAWSNKGNRNTFFVDEATKQPVAYTVEGYINAQDEVVGQDENGNDIKKKKWLTNDDIKALHDASGNAENPYIIGAGNQPFWGNIIINVEAGKTYWLFQHSSQIGFQGYEFAIADGIQDVIAAPAAKVMKTIKNGKIVIINGNNTYNVAGQLVK